MSPGRDLRKAIISRPESIIRCPDQCLSHFDVAALSLNTGSVLIFIISWLKTGWKCKNGHVAQTCGVCYIVITDSEFADPVQVHIVRRKSGRLWQIRSDGSDIRVSTN